MVPFTEKENFVNVGFRIVSPTVDSLGLWDIQMEASRFSLWFRRQTYRSGNCHHMNGFCSHRNKCPLSRKVYMVERGLK